MAYAREKARGKPKPKVLFSVMHSYAGLGYISEITAAGNDGFFSNLIEICGGVNAYEGRLPFPSLSREAIFQLNPDVIIDLMRSEEEAPDAMKGWRELGNVSAVRSGRVYIFTEESDTVPGPRAWKTIRKVADAIQPEPPLPRDPDGGAGSEPGDEAAAGGGDAYVRDAPGEDAYGGVAAAAAAGASAPPEAGRAGAPGGPLDPLVTGAPDSPATASESL
jgi:hypothetical protein